MAVDLWTLPHSRLTSTITDDLELNFYSRCPPEGRPRHLRERFPDVAEASRTPTDTELEDLPSKEKGQPAVAKDNSPTAKYDSSFPKALHQTFFNRIWAAGVLKLFSGEFLSFVLWVWVPNATTSDTLKTTTPLLTKVIFAWLTESYIYNRLSDEQRALAGLGKPKGIGYGIGLAFALFVMQRVFDALYP